MNGMMQRLALLFLSVGGQNADGDEALDPWSWSCLQILSKHSTISIRIPVAIPFFYCPAQVHLSAPEAVQ